MNSRMVGRCTHAVKRNINPFARIRTNSPSQFISLFNTHPIVSSINGCFCTFIYEIAHILFHICLPNAIFAHCVISQINRFGGDCLILKMCKTIWYETCVHSIIIHNLYAHINASVSLRCVFPKNEEMWLAHNFALSFFLNCATISHF